MDYGGGGSFPRPQPHPLEPLPLPLPLPPPPPSHATAAAALRHDGFEQQGQEQAFGQGVKRKEQGETNPDKDNKRRK